MTGDEKMNLDKACEDLRNAIDDLEAGRETFEIEEGYQHTKTDIILSLKHCLQGLEALNERIKEEGNTLELLRKVDEFTVWILSIQMKGYIRCLSNVFSTLKDYPEKAGLYKMLVHVDYSGTKRWVTPEQLKQVQKLQQEQIQFWVSQGVSQEDAELVFYLKILEDEE